MGAKLKSKTHLQNTFFDFLSRFLRVWLQSSKKVLIWPKKIIFLKKSKKVSKNAEFHADFESVEKVVKKCTKKVISKTSLTNMSKSEKGHFYVTFLLITFFFVHFVQKIFFKVILLLFSNFDCKCAGNGSKKQEIFFYECILEFNYAPIKGFA